MIFKISAIVSFVFFSLTVFSQPTYYRYACPSETTTFLQNSTNLTDPSEGYCGSGTEVRVIINGPRYLYRSVTAVRQGSNGDPHPVDVTIDWNPGETGVLSIQVENRSRHKLTCFLCFDCYWYDWSTLYTYVVSNESLLPSGAVTGQTVIKEVDRFTARVFSLSYLPATNYINFAPNIYATRIEYYNGNQIVSQPITRSASGYFPTPITYYGSGLGIQPPLNVRVYNSCGSFQDLPAITTLEVRPNCIDDVNPSLSIVGPVVLEDGKWLGEVTPNQTYTVVANNSTDFANNYGVRLKTGTNEQGFEWIDIQQKTFKLTGPISSYRIEAFNENLRSSCPVFAEPLAVFVGGRNHEFKEENGCPVVLPTDFGKLGFPNITSGDIVLEHFAGTVTSKRAITVKPGITLALGAEMILEQAPPGIDDPADPDLKMNFIQKTAYNEYNQIQAQSRSYFDDQGRALQSQSKNLSDGVVLATSTIYDAYNRPAISTLAAPISAIKVTTDVCTGEKQIGENIRFEFKPDFIQASDGTLYNVTHFDIKNNVVIEDAPVAVKNTTPGTLGWYYSTNNGSATGDNVKMNENQVAATNYPYSRTLFHRDGSGDVKGGTKPGDVFTAGLGRTAFSNTDKVPVGDIYLTAYLSMRQQDLGLTTPSDITGQFFKTEATDENGKRAVTYTDKGGKTIISLYFGSQLTPITKSYQFYDNVGRMIASVSPNGVNQYTGSNFASIDKSLHFYNHKGWLLAMEETDAGRTEYVYRKDGKIRFSQNAQQRTAGRYSYTHYDRSGRPIESGEYLPIVTGVTFKSSAMDALLENIEAGGGLPTTEGTFNNRVFSYYDLTAEALAVAGNADAQDFINTIGRTQRFVHGAVSYTKKDDYIKSWYSYDDQGRVEWMVQQIKDVGNKTLDYRYGPTGAVREVVYQKGITAEQFTHYYEYDVDGRLFKAYTTRQALSYEKSGDLSNPAVLELQATYFYYLHGPVKRIEYANKLQGIDYTYTPEGSLKGINHFDPDKDPGTNGQKDDLSTNGFRADVFGMTLDYYAGDYRSGAGTINATNVSPDQYGGLIKASRWHGPVQPTKQFGYAYTYDDRYQFKDAQWGQVVAGTLVLNQIKSYNEAVPNYDPNGNIKLLQRHNELGTSVADFNYQYAGNTNQLSTILNKGVNFRGYTYNHIGQMIEQTDPEGKKLKTNYDVTGKVTEVRDETNKLITTYVYDDRGFRLKKITPRETGGNLETVYIRDASGNVVATYENTVLTELPVYASGKIGLYKPQYGITFYEVADHLGNVRAVIGDKLKVDYLATLEDERVPLETDFKDLRPIPTSSFINHTPAVVTVEGTTTNISNPSKVMRINNVLDATKNPIGGGIFLWVHPGDKISTEVFAKYTNFNANNKTAVTGIAGFLASTFGSSKVIVDGLNILNGVDQVPTGVFTPLGNADDNLPKAFLTYVLLDKNMVPIAFDQAQVSTAAAIPLVDPENHAHERLSFTDIPIEKEGFIYIYVSNQSDQNMDVYFDDLKVTHDFSDIVAGGDFYPYGLEIVDRQIKRESYRYGYQGKYAERDDETGWNHFELREYDPVIGRWTTKDPEGQFYSPYVGMGNNPVSGVDPNGGLSFFDKYRLNSDATFDFIEADNNSFHSIYDANDNLLFTTSPKENERLGLFWNKNFQQNNSMIENIKLFERALYLDPVTTNAMANKLEKTGTWVPWTGENYETKIIRISAFYGGPIRKTPEVVNIVTDMALDKYVVNKPWWGENGDRNIISRLYHLGTDRSLSKDIKGSWSSLMYGLQDFGNEIKYKLNSGIYNMQYGRFVR